LNKKTAELGHPVKRQVHLNGCLATKREDPVDHSLVAVGILHIDITRLTVGVRVFGLGVFRVRGA